VVNERGQFFLRAVECQTAAGEHAHPRAQMRDVLDEMRRQQHGPCAPDLRDDLTQSQPLPRIQTHRRFVQDQDIRLVRQCSGHADTLALTAGQSPHP
jgi:hypothetical protein